MAIEKMELVNLVGLMDELDGCLDKCFESGCFHIEPAFTKAENGGLRMLNEKNEYANPLKMLSQTATNLGITLVETDYESCKLENAQDFTDFAKAMDNEYTQLNNKKQNALQSISAISGAVTQINHLKGLHSGFDRIFSCKNVTVRVGKLPTDNIDKLDYYDENFFFVPFETGKLFCYGMYFCPVEDKDIVDDLFRSMYFERIIIPDFVTGNTDEALERLSLDIEKQKKICDECDGELKTLSEKCEMDIQQAFSKLRFLHDRFELRKKVGELKGKFYIKGFVPQKDKESFEKLINQTSSVSVVYMPPDADASCVPPTILKNSWFTKPFSMMVEMYGLPDYGGFNPTAFVAVTYTLLFGIMFGDLGQGLLVAILGIIVGKKFNKNAGGMVTRCGVSSMVFGTIYGSFFGYEDLLDPVFESIGISFLPLKVFKQTNFILITAVAIGVALILMSMIINIYIGFKEKNYEKAIFGCNGIAGLVFYSSVAVGLVGTIMLDMKIMSLPFVLFLIVIPLICIFCRVPFSIAVKYKEFRLSEDETEKMTVGGFIVENFFEMFEFLLSYISNTMSFLRVGGFVLSHAGMMLVVMTLMEGCAAAAQPLVLIIGNAFVMAMEGMIVAIQIIRLEFYEIFSRFNESDGVAFEPVGVKFSSQVE